MFCFLGNKTSAYCFPKSITSLTRLRSWKLHHALNTAQRHGVVFSLESFTFISWKQILWSCLTGVKLMLSLPWPGQRSRRHLGCSVEKCSQSVAGSGHNNWQRTEGRILRLWSMIIYSWLGVSPVISSLCFQFSEWPGSFLAGDLVTGRARDMWLLVRTMLAQWDNLLLSRGLFSSAHSKYSWDLEETVETITLLRLVIDHGLTTDIGSNAGTCYWKRSGLF